MNRAWEQFFGRGLVETSEDFGTQGAPPSHPELLDWLATELVQQKWSIKSLHRLIVTSATYRQSAAATPALLERDPYNRLFARGPRFRHGGGDAARHGARRERPAQPEDRRPERVPAAARRHLGQSVQRREVGHEHRARIATAAASTRSSVGRRRIRASMAFDGTSREFCTVRRVRTNTPLQALATLNDEAFFEAARALAADPA